MCIFRFSNLVSVRPCEDATPSIFTSRNWANIIPSTHCWLPDGGCISAVRQYLHCQRVFFCMEENIIQETPSTYFNNIIRRNLAPITAVSLESSRPTARHRSRRGMQPRKQRHIRQADARFFRPAHSIRHGALLIAPERMGPWAPP